MTEKDIQRIPIAEIHIANPRSRNKTKFQTIVSSIDAVGLKKPITVTMHELSPDGTRYELVCGQGRLEAFLALGETSIPAIVVDVEKEDRFLMVSV